MTIEALIKQHGSIETFILSLEPTPGYLWGSYDKEDGLIAFAKSITDNFPQDLLTSLNSFLRSLHTPKERTARALYKIVTKHPEFLDSLIKLIRTQQQRALTHSDQLEAHRTALGWSTLLTLTCDEKNNTLLSFIDKQYIKIIPELIALSQINFDAYKLIYSALSHKNKIDYSISILQSDLMDAFDEYLKIVNPTEAERLSKKIIGLCAGTAICYSLFSYSGKRYWWNDLLSKVASWDKTEAELQTKYTLIDSERSESLATLIERALNYLLSAQHVDFMYSLQPEISIKQDKGYEVKTMKRIDKINAFFLPGQLSALLSDNKKNMPQMPCVIHFDLHACSIVYDEKSDLWILYDSNNPLGDITCKTSDELEKKIRLVPYFTENLELRFINFNEQPIQINSDAIYYKDIMKHTGFHLFIKQGFYEDITLESLCKKLPQEAFLTDLGIALITKDSTKLSPTGAQLLFMNPSLLHDLFICIKKSAQATELTRENLVKSLLITNSKNESGAYTLLTCNNSGVIQTVFSFIDEDTKMSVPARMHCITALMQMSDLLDTLYSAASRSHPLLSTFGSYGPDLNLAACAVWMNALKKQTIIGKTLAELICTDSPSQLFSWLQLFKTNTILSSCAREAFATALMLDQYNDGYGPVGLLECEVAHLEAFFLFLDEAPDVCRTAIIYWVDELLKRPWDFMKLLSTHNEALMALLIKYHTCDPEVSIFMQLAKSMPNNAYQLLQDRHKLSLFFAFLETDKSAAQCARYHLMQILAEPAARCEMNGEAIASESGTLDLVLDFIKKDPEATVQLKSSFQREDRIQNRLGLTQYPRQQGLFPMKEREPEDIELVAASKPGQKWI